MDNSLNSTTNVAEPFINLIMGPMFSGKTTKLINCYNEFVKTHGKEKCLAINYAMDKRYTNESKIVSHDGISIDCYDTTDLFHFINSPLTQQIFLKAKYIFINEAQFFPNLLNLTLLIKNILNKNFILCGLDYDYKREQFGELLDLVSHSNNVYNLTGTCNTPNCINPSTCSHRVVNFNNQILIGNTCYVPLCLQCYNRENYRENVRKNNTLHSNLNYYY